MTANSLSRHRVTDRWDLRFNGHLYRVTRDRAHGDYPDNWEVVAIRNAPNGGQYEQYLTDSSKRKLAIIRWVGAQLREQELTQH